MDQGNDHDGDASVRTSRTQITTASAAAGLKDGPLDDEEVHVDRIRHKRNFAGSLLPEHMIPKAFKVRIIFYSMFFVLILIVLLCLFCLEISRKDDV